MGALGVSELNVRKATKKPSRLCVSRARASLRGNLREKRLGFRGLGCPGAFLARQLEGGKLFTGYLRMLLLSFRG